jgi:hypothetical protein
MTARRRKTARLPAAFDGTHHLDRETDRGSGTENFPGVYHYRTADVLARMCVAAVDIES